MRTRIEHLCWEEFRDLVPTRTDLVFVPVGTLEAHGGLPLGTDTFIADHLALTLAPRYDALVAPAIGFGVTNTLLPYPGSTTVRSSTFREHLFEAAAGLVDAGFRRVVLINGHGGQSSEVAEVVARLWNDRRAFAAAVEWWGIAEEPSRRIWGEHASGHAGIEETAMMLAIDPQSIDLDRHARARRAARQPGLRARPFPATIILDRKERDGDGAPDFDPAHARDFYQSVLDRLHELLDDLFAGWAALRR